MCVCVCMCVCVHFLRQKLLTYSRYILEITIPIISAMNMPKWHLLQQLESSESWWRPPHHGSWCGPHLPNADRLLDPLGYPDILLHGKLDTIPIDGMVCLCHMVCKC